MLTSTMTKTVAVVLAMTAVGLCHAAPITIANPSFETPSLNDGGYSESIPGWAVTTTSGAGIQNVNTANWFTSLPAGNNVAMCTYETFLTQTLSSTLSAGDYTLSAWVGIPAPFIAGPQPFTISLYAGTTLLAQVGDVATTGVLTPYTVSYTASAGNTHLGEALKIEFHSESEGRIAPGTLDWNLTSVDGFALSYVPVPEPASLALLGLGALALLRRRRA